MWCVIIGNIGVGKSTLAKMLADHFKWEAKFEAVEGNPYLEDFYRDMNRYAFESQIYFMDKKLIDIIDIKSKPDKVYIQDRSILDDRIAFVPTLYEQCHLEKRSYETYCELYNSIDALIGKPDLIIFIKSSIGNLTTQITKRGREMESNLSVSYLQSLNEKYNEFANSYQGNMIVIDGDTLKFEQNPKDFEVITDLIKLNIEKL